MTYQYRAFGLEINSEFECPEFSLSDGPPDVQIVVGETPGHIENVVSTGPYFEVKPHALLFFIDEIGRFYVTDGNRIVIEPAAGTDDEAIRLFLLGIVFAGLLHQRGLLPLHGSAVETDNGVAVFVGHPGAGKSTTAGAFRKRGYRVFTDDLCVIGRRADGKPEVYPGYPEMKMTEESADRLGVSTDSLRNIEWWKRKYMVPFRDGFTDKSQVLSSIYLLSPSDRDNFGLDPITGAERFQVLVAHTFRNSFIDGLGTGQTHFELSTAVARHARMKRVIRPRSGFRIDELLDLLVCDLQSV